MKKTERVPVFVLAAVLTLSTAVSFNFAFDASLPNFGKDTVLVWKTASQSKATTFVVRIAEFLPNRFFEWENATTQGTVLIDRATLSDAESFVSSRLFEAGKDTEGKGVTTLWLSRKIFEELKAETRVKLKIDSIPGWMEVEATGQITVTVNKSRLRLPVLKTRDSRGSERWFLDLENNPLMVKHVFRSYSQTLSSITTDRSNTLRWIKGKKLKTPRQIRE